MDSFRLRDLLDADVLPTKRTISERLSNGTVALPPSITPGFLADAIFAALEESDREHQLKVGGSHLFDVKRLKPGTADASKYHKQVFSALCFALNPWLKNGTIEREVDAGRKRIDILFDNAATEGFFQELRTIHEITSRYIFIECKNYTTDPENPEFDQLIGRFHDKRGRFGMMVCRSLSDKAKIIARCNDALASGNGCILVFDDTDVSELVAARNRGDLPTVEGILSARFREVLLNAR